MATCISCKSDKGQWQDEDKNPKCDECRAKPRVRYYMLNRPPGFATIPDGWIEYDVWMPSRTIPGSTWNALGWVEFTAPLAPEQVWKWELYCADDDERLAYQEWREENSR